MHRLNFQHIKVRKLLKYTILLTLLVRKHDCSPLNSIVSILLTHEINQLFSLMIKYYFNGKNNNIYKIPKIRNDLFNKLFLNAYQSKLHGGFFIHRLDFKLTKVIK